MYIYIYIYTYIYFVFLSQCKSLLLYKGSIPSTALQCCHSEYHVGSTNYFKA